MGEQCARLIKNYTSRINHNYEGSCQGAYTVGNKIKQGGL